MNDNTFNALISLLDDPDPIVIQHVEMELYNLGAVGIEKLEEAWENSQDAWIQSRIEDLISKIQTKHYTEALIEWRINGGTDLLEGWMLLTQIQYPTLNVQKYRSEVQKLVSRIWIQLDPRMNEIERLCIVNKQFYTVEKYNGNYQEPDKPDNSYLSVIMDTKKGNSLSLSTLYLIVCEQLEIPLQIINFVGYFAIRCFRRTSHFYIDAYNQGMFFTPQQVQEFLEKLNAEAVVTSYKPLPNSHVILYMISGLILNYRQNELHDKADRFEQLLHDLDDNFGGK